MPGEVRRRPVFRLLVYLPNSARNGHPSLTVRRPGVLAGYQTPVQGTFPVVAHGHRSGPNTPGTSGTVTAGRRQPRRRSSAGMAAAEHLKIATTKLLRSVLDSGTLSADAFSVPISGPGPLLPKISHLFASSSLRIPPPAGAGFRPSSVRHGSGNKPTALCATWFAAACYSCSTEPTRSSYRRYASK